MKNYIKNEKLYFYQLVNTILTNDGLWIQNCDLHLAQEMSFTRFHWCMRQNRILWPSSIRDCQHKSLPNNLRCIWVEYIVHSKWKLLKQKNQKKKKKKFISSCAKIFLVAIKMNYQQQSETIISHWKELRMKFKIKIIK